MADKKLLNVTFASYPGGYYTVNIGANSSDHINEGPNGPEHRSQDVEMKQTGCIIFNSTGNTALSYIEQFSLYKPLDKAGYKTRIILEQDTGQHNVPMYLNGQPVDADGNPQPYVMFESQQGDFGTSQLYYYTADGVCLGKMLGYGYGGTVPHNFADALLGKLYTDGTMDGQRAIVWPQSIGAVYSGKYYNWQIKSNYFENGRIIPEEIINDLNEYLPIEPEGDFMDPGVGNFDGTSDDVAYPGLPPISALDSGMVAMYEMQGAQLRTLSNYLWTSNFDTAIKKMFNDPMESILNLAIMPIEFYNLVPSTIKIGNILTPATGNALTTPYKIIDFGTINLLEYWGSFADYSPYTKLSIFLPYVGTQNISIDDVMNGSIQLKAYCDCLTGSIQYMLYSIQNNHRGHNHASVLYTWGGNMQYQIPITASNFSSVVSSLIGAGASIAGGIGASIATGGMTAPIALGMATSTISNVMNAKTHVQRGGGIGGAVGLFGVQTPYLILERPEQIYPENYDHTIGIPNPVKDYLINYTGFVKVNEVHLEIPNATKSEISEIEQLLKDGVVV